MVCVGRSFDCLSHFISPCSSPLSAPPLRAFPTWALACVIDTEVLVCMWGLMCVGEQAKILGRMWGALSEDDKNKYQQLAVAT